MNKILIAIDDSEGALKAVDFVGRQFAGMSNLKIDILHVIPNLPAPLWDDGHILTEEERGEKTGYRQMADQPGAQTETDVRQGGRKADQNGLKPEPDRSQDGDRHPRCG